MRPKGISSEGPPSGDLMPLTEGSSGRYFPRGETKAPKRVINHKYGFWEGLGLLVAGGILSLGGWLAYNKYTNSNQQPAISINYATQPQVQGVDARVTGVEQRTTGLEERADEDGGKIKVLLTLTDRTAKTTNANAEAVKGLAQTAKQHEKRIGETEKFLKEQKRQLRGLTNEHAYVAGVTDDNTKKLENIEERLTQKEAMTDYLERARIDENTEIGLTKSRILTLEKRVNAYEAQRGIGSGKSALDLGHDSVPVIPLKKERKKEKWQWSAGITAGGEFPIESALDSGFSMGARVTAKKGRLNVGGGIRNWGYEGSASNENGSSFVEGSVTAIDMGVIYNLMKKNKWRFGVGGGAELLLDEYTGSADFANGAHYSVDGSNVGYSVFGEARGSFEGKEWFVEGRLRGGGSPGGDGTPYVGGGIDVGFKF